MNNQNKKCSLKKHEDNDAIFFCPDCKVYMCNKCENFHSNLFENHHQIKLDKDISEIFTGLCSIQNHNYELEYFCKNHYILCCLACISKIKKKGKGQHSLCDVCIIEDIQEEKRNQLKRNINILDNLSKTLEDSIEQIKIIFEKLNENKESVKLKIQKIFTKIRNAINEREDKLLLEVDNKFGNLVKEDLI